MVDNISTYLLFIPALPLLAALLTAALGAKVLKENSHLPIIIALAVSFACSLMLVNEVNKGYGETDGEGGYSRVYRLWTWASVDTSEVGNTSGSEAAGAPFTIDVTLRADALTAIMLSMVTFVSTLVAIFAAGYMHGDRGYWRFFTYIGLFVFSMTMLVSVSNFMLLFVFWEAVGACSYLLIGFWYEKPSAAAAGKKAFLVNRIGDFGFVLAIFLIFTTYGTLNYHDASEVHSIVSLDAEVASSGSAEGVLSVNRIHGERFVGGGVGLAICLLLLVGACGKSAQFPLHVWLPDAMEGPTPVSALIHAATMVTAGVYMVTRCIPLFVANPTALVVVSVIGGFTALMAALIALSQFDLKRVLAYSTISQLGYMFLALGAGTLAGVSAGMFHLFTHAFFKALLFLAAGSVMHAMGNVIDMRRFGGLRKIMPITCWTFAIGAVALAGLVPFSGFWSKDSVLGAVHDKAHAIHAERDHRIALHDGEHLADESAHADGNADAHSAHAVHDGNVKKLSDDQLAWHGNVYQVLYYLGIFTSFLTAFYTFRAFFMTFYGKQEVPPEAHGHAHESPALMWIPLTLLAVCAAGIGGAFFVTDLFSNFLSQAPSLALGAITDTPVMAWANLHADVAAISTIVAILGITAAAFFYLGESKEIEKLRDASDLGWVRRLADKRWPSPLRSLTNPLVWAITAAVFLLLVALYGFGKREFAVGSESILHQVAYLRAIPLVTDFTALTELSTEASATLSWANAFELALRNTIFIWLAVIAVWGLFVIATYFSPLAIFTSPYKLSTGKFYFDEIYYFSIVWPLQVLAKFAYWFDRTVVDGFVNTLARIPPLGGSLLRGMQVGLVQFYAVAMIFGVLVLLFARILLAS